MFAFRKIPASDDDDKTLGFLSLSPSPLLKLIRLIDWDLYTPALSNSLKYGFCDRPGIHDIRIYKMRRHRSVVFTRVI